MKRLILIFVLCGLLLPSAYGETISHTFANGETYVGEVMNRNMHGQGTYTWPDGEKYVGGWKDNEKHGRGTWTAPDGAQYVGEWKRDNYHGQGTYTHANGIKFIGRFKNNHAWDAVKYNKYGRVVGKRIGGMPAPQCDEVPSGPYWGMGFAVDQYHVVTNAHMLYCCKKVTVYDLSCSDSEVTTVVSTEQKSDLGLLRLDKPLKDYAALRSGKALQFGEAVSAYDNRSTMNVCPRYLLRQGKVTKLDWLPNDFRLMKHDVPVRERSSGGPVLDKAGQVIAVHQRGVGGARSSAVKAYLLKAFLESNNVEYKTSSSTEKLSLSGIKRKSDKFTVAVQCERHSEPTVSKASGDVTQTKVSTTMSSECKPVSQCFSLDASRGGYTKPEAGMSENTCKSTGGKWRCIEDCDCN